MAAQPESLSSAPAGAPAPTTRIAHWSKEPATRLGMFGAELEMSPEERAMIDTLHRFAEQEMRPLGRQLDRMTPEAVIAPDSPLWPFYKRFGELGFTVDLMLDMPPRERAKLMCMFYEELGWGDSGLGISVAASTLPRYLCRLFGNDYLASLCPDDKLGCWGITEPDHGSDSLDPNQQIAHATGKYGRPNCVAKISGDRIVINGQKSAWVSNGTVAQVCILYCAADTGAGADTRNGAVVIVPLDSKGVSRGKPLDKMGQRALPQGEIFFDNVEVPIRNLLAGPEHFQRCVYAIHAEANGLMGACFTGVARAAFEHALAYAHERKQGGVPLIRHQSVANRLFHMFRKVEAARALTRRVVEYNMVVAQPSLPAAMTVKVTGTQTAFEVASEALQMFGGNGMTREYPMEKLLRDARASMIEDGCNEILALKGGFGLADPERL
ncbi:MAG TPA: acyl-CoA dehydrogenase [Gammaproteobacteria bacterium]|nr:acyl-CoA dehydrogenase [Gammaproteobacteria bacterium]